MPDFVVKSPDGMELTITGDTPPSEQELDSIFADARSKKGLKPPAKERTWTDTIADALPTAGGIIGGLAGGIQGAGIGGAAGEGYRQLVKHAGEIPGAIADVSRNIFTQPAATLRGAIGGAGSGALEAVEEGGKQAAGEAIGLGVGAVAKPVLKHVAGAVMQSAVKPGVKATTRAFMRGVAPEDLPVVKTLLNEGISVSQGGIAKLDKIISASNDEVSDIIKNLPGAIQPSNVAKRVDPVIAEAMNQVNRRADVGAAKGAVKEFLADYPNALSPIEAQNLKKGTYKALGKKAYGELGSTAIESQKAIARGLKEEVEQEANRFSANLGDKVAAINAREGKAIDAKEAIAKRLAAAGNRDHLALAWLAHNPTTAVLYMMERSPAAKSLLARGLWNSAAAATGVSPQVVKLAMASLLGSSEQPEGR